MITDCPTSGGKGNIGKFFEREPRICAAGICTTQPNDFVADNLQQYSLQDEVDALLSDAIIPSPKERPLPKLRKPTPPDYRFAGPFGQVSQLINPSTKTKFQTLVDDFKDTIYASYWKSPLGKRSDPIPLLPEGFDIEATTMGKKTPFHGRLYDLVMPKEPLLDKTHYSKRPGRQIDRNYSPPYDPNHIYGYVTNVDKRGMYAKCTLTDKKETQFTLINTVQANFQERNQTKIGKVLAPNENIKEVPSGYSFGKLNPPDNLAACLCYCNLNPDKEFLKKCLNHLNTLRKNLISKFLPNFFHTFYLQLKFLDKDKNGWLPTNIIYETSGSKLIRFNPSLIEPILSIFNAFDGKCIDYKIFVDILNYRKPLPDFPKIEDIPKECIDFRTTYSEMTKPGQLADSKGMAGIPSGRYFDLDYPVTPENCCKADRKLLPHETDMKSCLNPSILTLMHVNHRDMYAKRDEHMVRRVFKAAGENFSDEKFINIWKKAQKYHPEGWVSFETFRRALQEQQ